MFRFLPFACIPRWVPGLGGRPRITTYPSGARIGLNELISGGCPVGSKSRRRIDKVDLQNIDRIWVLFKVFPCKKLRALPSQPGIEFVCPSLVGSEYEGILAPRTIIWIGGCIWW